MTSDFQNSSVDPRTLIDAVVCEFPPHPDSIAAVLNASPSMQRACVLAAVDVAESLYPAWRGMDQQGVSWSHAVCRIRSIAALFEQLFVREHAFTLVEIDRIAAVAAKDAMTFIFPKKQLATVLLVAGEQMTPTRSLAENIASIATQSTYKMSPAMKAKLLALSARLYAEADTARASRTDSDAMVQSQPLAEEVPDTSLREPAIIERVLAQAEPPTAVRPSINATALFADTTLPGTDGLIVREIVSVIEEYGARTTRVSPQESVRETAGCRALLSRGAGEAQRALAYCHAIMALLCPLASHDDAPAHPGAHSPRLAAQSAANALCFLGEALIAPASGETPTPEAAEQLLLAAQMLESRNAPSWPGPQTFELIEMAYKAASLSKRARAAATAMRAHFVRTETDSWRHIATRLDTILGTRPELLDPADRFAAEALDELAAMTPDRRSAWRALLEHALGATGSKPSAKWLKACDNLIKNVSEQDFTERVTRWFALVGKKPETPEGMPTPYRDLTVPLETNAQALKGLVLMCARFDNAKMAGTLGDLSLVSFKLVPGVGGRCIKVGTACIWSLSEMQGEYAAAQLSRARQLVKFGSARKWLDQAIDRVAFAAGLTADELQEVCTPDYDLSRDAASFATRRVTLGGFTAELAITGTTSAEIRIRDEHGVLRKSVPAAIKKEYAAELKALQESAKDIEKMLPAQRDRLERLMADERTWPFATWRERYIDHPLVGPAARRLIWEFSSAGNSAQAAAPNPAETTLGMVHEGAIVGIEREPLRWLNDADDAMRRRIAVKLWHPLGADASLVAQCRQMLSDCGITQPFKQAHREVYLLTDAERRTRTYSNRFAAHIVRYPQLTKLGQDRGWTAGTLVVYDPSYCKNPLIKLPRWDVGAELFVEGAGDETTPAGIYSYAQTDQVRFFSLRAPAESLPLDQVPALVFSEVMRDVDLFVAVASVGNDPTWQDRGERASEQFNTYWQRFAWGELSVGAEARRDLLEKLLPRLAIRDKCSLLERFLVVQGALRRYKIHLGSGNILMEPNDQYLCIVPKSATAGEAAAAAVRLPFEGDRTLTVILSKAFMLADDANITDPTITSQIRV
jgi:hypothetical protein